jgi:DNA polymerase III epsilon subunit-like protein
VALPVVLGEFAEFSQGGVLAGYNVAFDWMFLKTACARHAVMLKADYHIFDVFSVAWLHSRTVGQPKSLRLTHLAQLYELPPQPEPHTALADAQLTLELLRAVNRRLG